MTSSNNSMNTSASLSTMKISDWLRDSTQLLKNNGVNTARLDCLVLLGDALGKDKGWLLAHPEEPVQGSTLYGLDEQLQRRAEHEPLAYIREKSEFYGREFIVSNHTLEPRPETETMIDLLKQLTANDESLTHPQKTGNTKLVTENEDLQILDIGTGSGCLAITAKLEWPMAQVSGVDIDSDCIRVAIQNAEAYKAEVDFLKGNLLAPLLSANFQLPTSIILANLPYVPDAHTINKAAMHEPSHALFGGEDGLDYYRKLFSQMNSMKHAPLYVLTESLPFQHKALIAIASERKYTLEASDDFIQAFSRA